MVGRLIKLCDCFIIKVWFKGVLGGYTMKKLIVILISLLSVQITFASPMRLALISAGAIRRSLSIDAHAFNSCVERQVILHRLKNAASLSHVSQPAIRSIGIVTRSASPALPKITFETCKIVGKYFLQRAQEVVKHTFSSLVLERAAVRKNFIQNIYQEVGFFIAQLPAGVVPDAKILSAGIIKALCKLTPK